MLRRMNHDDRASLPAAVICATVSLWALGSSLLGAPRDAGEAVREVTIAKLATAKAGARIPTHVRLSGVVGSVRHEADRDYHISLCEADGSPCITVEVIPLLSADRIVVPKTRIARASAVVRKGDRIEVEGISRWDAWHGWWEVHPATAIRVLGAAGGGA